MTSPEREKFFLIPGLRVMRELPVRRLTPAECDTLEYRGPLVLAQRQHRFLIAWWRSLDEYVVMNGPRILMTCTAAQLAERGVPVDGPLPAT